VLLGSTHQIRRQRPTERRERKRRILHQPDDALRGIDLGDDRRYERGEQAIGRARIERPRLGIDGAQHEPP
jgi:hypothetical protein